ncbi:hypothetical protein [Halanaerobacter jeridensis]|uniref:Uncharacterized protein n=1 Tax=Halanaerobacter jeridensis TaxID=706427 RepID=A0A939BMG0_9FIRM|nr:hypothetical protein [Halanaerobacter jeridensis]MBM7556370.1 hypothetical protein [Halanaerobacter jeridensis]
MKLIFNSSMLLILFVFLVVGTAYGNLASNSNQVGINCKVDKYVKIQCDDIEEDAWIDYDAPEWLSLKNRLRWSRDKSSTNGEGSPFTGQGGEVKWARQEVTVRSNTFFRIRAEASYPAHSDSKSVLHNKWGKPKTFYSYLLPICGPIGFARKIIPGENSAYLPGVWGTTKYILASKIAMPEEFWRVEAGHYVGKITLTVESF